jgi:hypothetical protein
MYVCIMHICMYLCLCMCVYMYVCMYACTQTNYSAVQISIQTLTCSEYAQNAMSHEHTAGQLVLPAKQNTMLDIAKFNIIASES